ncbi:hypothetical protein H6P81_015594 [Aristolochia fimbriata]|uniref:Uncharacterized protein n=1 Tax=Aristolochia fimbriata TaxID=158543 RepID=A0AAV7E6N5_ARIFI|nr:hypothetical protein H6P81_015594 [Aristolochia fimbriata]
MFVDLGTSVSHRPLALYGPSFQDSSLRRSSTQAGNALATSSPARRAILQLSYHETTSTFIRRNDRTVSKKVFFGVPRATGSSSSGGSQDDSEGSSDQKNSSNTPFGYTRKDVLLIGVGVTVAGIGLKSGLEFAGVDPLQAGNVVQLVLVLGLTVGWISTYIFRVSNKDMTYAKQLRDYENKVMQKRLEGLTEAELEALLEQVEEEKRQLASGEQV